MTIVINLLILGFLLWLVYTVFRIAMALLEMAFVGIVLAVMSTMNRIVHGTWKLD